MNVKWLLKLRLGNFYLGFAHATPRPPLVQTAIHGDGCWSWGHNWAPDLKQNTIRCTACGITAKEAIG